MPRPYSNDLRWRAIWMIELLGYSVDKVAVERYISKCLNTGDVNWEKLGRPFNSFAMHPHVEFVIMEAILEQPGTTLAEIAYNVFEQTGSENAVSSILRCLKRNSFTRKKVCTNTNLLWHCFHLFFNLHQSLCDNWRTFNNFCYYHFFLQSYQKLPFKDPRKPGYFSDPVSVS